MSTTDDDASPRGAATDLVHHGRDPAASHGFVNTPLYRGSTVLFPTVAALKAYTAPFTYGRRGTPTTVALEKAIAHAEGGAGTGSFIFGPPTKANPIEVEDCLVLPNFDLPAGMSVMGVWREFAVWMHEGLSIALSDSHDDYFIKNLVAILAEFACAAGAMETVAFCEISAGSGS